MCPDTFFLESVLVAHEQEKYYVDVSYTGRTGMHYVTHISHQMQKHKFGVMCLYMFSLEFVPVPPEQEK
jgi:hypothetical protein